jgi:NAD(P)-dependent dehydrogenase (short-subunit alcohol dehydrogenase family)
VRTPLSLGEPVEIANRAVFRASDESSFSTGAEFVTDGGELAGLIRHSSTPAREAVRVTR